MAVGFGVLHLLKNTSKAFQSQMKDFMGKKQKENLTEVLFMT